MGIDKDPLRIKVSELQIRCLEIAGGEVAEIVAGLAKTYAGISEAREARKTFITGAATVASRARLELREISELFLGMAQSLRRSGLVEVVPVFEMGSDRTRPVNFCYRLYGDPENPQQKIEPSQSFSAVSWGVNSAVSRTLFDSDDLKGNQLLPRSRSDLFHRALNSHRIVSLIYEPPVDYQI